MVAAVKYWIGLGWAAFEKNKKLLTLKKNDKKSPPESRDLQKPFNEIHGEQTTH